MALIGSGNPRGILENFSSQIRNLPIESEQKSQLADFTLNEARDSNASDNLLWGYVQDIDSKFGFIRNGSIGESSKGSYAYLQSNIQISEQTQKRSFFNRNQDDINNINLREISNIRDSEQISSQTSLESRSGATKSNLSLANISNTIASVLTNLQYSKKASKFAIDTPSTDIWQSRFTKAHTVELTLNGYVFPGFIDESGIQLAVYNNYEDLFVGGLAGAVGQTWQQLSAAGQTWQQLKVLESVGKQALNSENIKKAFNATKTLAGAATINNKASGVIMNTVLYWTGSNPLDISFKFYQIAQSHGEIMNNYRTALIQCSPDLKGGGNDGLIWGVDEPLKKGSSIDLWGNLKLEEILVESLTVNIRGPFDKKKSPVIGEYTFKGKTQKIVSKKLIEDLWAYIEEQGPEKTVLDMNLDLGTEQSSIWR